MYDIARIDPRRVQVRLPPLPYTAACTRSKKRIGIPIGALQRGRYAITPAARMWLRPFSLALDLISERP